MDQATTGTDAADTTKLRECEEGRKRDSEELKAARETNEAQRKQFKALQQQEANTQVQYAALNAEYRNIYGFAEKQMAALNAANKRTEQLEDELLAVYKDHDDMPERIQQLKEDLYAMRQQYEDAQAAQESFSRMLSIAEGKLKDGKNEQNRGAGDTQYQIEEAGKKHDRLEREFAAAQEKIEEIEKKLKSWNDECDKLRKGEGSGDDKGDRKELEEAERKIKVLRENMEDAEEKIKDLRQEIQDVRHDAAEDGKANRELQDQRDELYGQIDVLQGQMNTCDVQLGHTDKQLAQTKAEAESLRKELEARQTKLDDCEALKRKQEGDDKYTLVLQQQIAKLKEELENIRRQLDDKQGKLDDCESRSRQQAEQLKEVEEKQKEPAKPEVLPENNSIVRAGTNDATPAAKTDEKTAKADGAKQDGAPANGPTPGIPLHTAPQSAGTSPPAHGLNTSQLPLRNSENAIPNLQGMGTNQPATATLTLTSTPGSRGKLNPATDEFTLKTTPGSTLRSGTYSKPPRTPQSGMKSSASQRLTSHLL